MSDQPVAKATTYTARTKHKRRTTVSSVGNFFVRAFFSFFRSVLISHIPLQHRTPTPMPPAGFEPAIPATKRQTYAQHRADTGTG
jgi:hypothetical protein